MNILTLGKILEAVRLDELDADLWPGIVAKANEVLPRDKPILSTMTGDELYQHYLTLTASEQAVVVKQNVCPQKLTVSIMADVRKAIELKEIKADHDDSIKTSFILYASFICLGVCIIGFLAYIFTASSRGAAPDSAVLSALTQIIAAILKVVLSLPDAS